MAEKRVPGSSVNNEREVARLLQLENDPTETIDLGRLFTKDITSSGSFDVRGDIWASTFGKLLQSLPIPALLVDEYRRVMAANQACGRLGSDYESILDRPFETLFPNSSQAAKASKVLKEVFDKRKPKAIQGMLRIGKGSWWARLTFRCIRILDVRSVLVLVEDLTHERKLLLLSQKYQEELERRVEQRTAELAEANIRLQKEMAERKKAEDMLVRNERLRAMGEMSAGVAHNIKNLIQIVYGFTHTAMHQVEIQNSLAAREALDSILEALQHGAETVRQLQGFARMDPAEVSEQMPVFDLSALAKQAVDFTKPFWQSYPQRRGIRIDMKVALAHTCFVWGNQSQIFEVLVNLIKNAAESLSEGGEIDLRTAVANGQVILTIRDTGVGIRQEDMDRLFTPFFTTKGDAGTGLGLATSRSVIEKHGGAISAQSTYGRGTTFTVKLPLALSEEGEAGNAYRAQAGRKLNVLVIDDMESTLMMVKLGLEAYQHSVFTARSGEEALETFRTHRFDLVLCDLAMPGMNGWLVGRKILDICREIGIPRPFFLLLSAWTQQAVQETRPPESQVDAIIEKPFEIPELIELIENLMGPDKYRAS